MFENISAQVVPTMEHRTNFRENVFCTYQETSFEIVERKLRTAQADGVHIEEIDGQRWRLHPASIHCSQLAKEIVALPQF